MKKAISIIKQSGYSLIILFGIILVVSYFLKMPAALVIADNFWLFFVDMIIFLPFIFILIGLIDVWIPKERIENHIGNGSGLKGSILIILFAMLQAGPLYAAFPVTYILWKKGCSIRNIFIYLGAFSTIKLPMLVFEVSFLGLNFSLIRSIVTFPIFIFIAWLMELYLKDKNFEIKDN